MADEISQRNGCEHEELFYKNLCDLTLDDLIRLSRFAVFPVVRPGHKASKTHFVVGELSDKFYDKTVEAISKLEALDDSAKGAFMVYATLSGKLTTVPSPYSYTSSISKAMFTEDGLQHVKMDEIVQARKGDELGEQRHDFVDTNWEFEPEMLFDYDLEDSDEF